jgi:hypothetical protein
MTTQFLQLASDKGLQNVTLTENTKEARISFSPIGNCNKMNKVGQAFNKMFGSENIGWNSSSITIIK